MLRRFLSRMHHNQKGITGLETAIILIAFVVVAAVFAFTALSAGLFSSEKSKEAVYSGLEQAQSTMELKGSVVSNAVEIINDNEAITGWTASDGANTPVSLENTIVKENTGSLQIDCAETASQNDYVYNAFVVAQSFSSTSTISFWIYTDDAGDAGLTSGDLVFALGTDSDLSAAEATMTVPDVADETWVYVSGSPTGTFTSAMTHYGFQYTDTTPARTIYIDMIQGPLRDSSRDDPPVAVVDSVDFMVVNSLGGEPINFALPTDSNSDGVLTSDDNSGVKTNYLTISYSDAYQQVNDLAWSVTRIVGTDDYLLENNEIFKISVDLKAVNLGATSSDERLGSSHTFDIEVKPNIGAVLVLEKTTPYVLNVVDDLN